MPHYFLREDVHYAVKDETAILLDSRTVKYYGLPKSELDRLLDTPNGVPLNSSNASREADRGLHTLLELGLLTDNPEKRSHRHAPPTSPTDSITLSGYRNHRIRITSRHIATFITSWLYVILNLRAKRLARLLSKSRPTGAAAGALESGFDRHGALELLEAFTRLRVWFYTADEQCLKDSLVLSRFLRANGYAPTLVFAVDTRPFSAHAWVQLGRTVINELLERAHRFTLILAVKG